MIIYSALMQGMVSGSERQAVNMNQGDIQIHANGYRDDPDIYNTIPQSDHLIRNIRNAGFSAAERRYGFGLVANDNNSSGVQLRGIDLIHEQQVTEIHLQLIAGNWLDNNDPYGIVIGKKLSRQLDAKIGSELVFIGQTSDGFMANEIFTIRGILKSISSMIDSSAIFISNSSLSELLTLPDGAHEIVIMRSNRNTNLLDSTQKVQSIASGLETLNWRELMPVIARFLETADVQIMIMLVFTYIAVASVVLNATLMSVFERIHEFGIMKAIGVTPTQTVSLIYAETLLQTAIASITGIIFGWWISNYFQNYGIDMSALANEINFAGIALDPVWHAEITSDVLSNPVLFLFLISILAVIYPAIKVARIKAIDAIHYK